MATRPLGTRLLPETAIASAYCRISVESIRTSPSSQTKVGALTTGLMAANASKARKTEIGRCSNGRPSSLSEMATRHTYGESSMPISCMGERFLVQTSGRARCAAGASGGFAGRRLELEASGERNEHVVEGAADDRADVAQDQVDQRKDDQHVDRSALAEAEHRGEEEERNREDERNDGHQHGDDLGVLMRRQTCDLLLHVTAPPRAVAPVTPAIRPGRPPSPSDRRADPWRRR